MQGEGIKLNDRRRSILALLSRDGKVQVAQLSALLGASEVTIRSDLTEMEKEGLLERVHGGAMPARRSYLSMNMQQRRAENVEQKMRIAAAAAERIREGETLMVNAGTTALFTAMELKKLRNIKVVTNSIPIAMELSGCPGIQLIALGGHIDPQHAFTYGDDALNQLRRYKADRLILSVDGVDAEGGLSTYHYEASELNRLMIERARAVAVTADYTKIGYESFSHIAPSEACDVLITDGGASRSQLDALAARGIEVVVV
ncbi:MAG: DeoR/GlpR transcriptional regulator [Clostridiales bacterium]|nr:DeoR/GlpR transcriptional regulator [Clostridiales bacterium]